MQDLTGSNGATAELWFVEGDELTHAQAEDQTLGFDDPGSQPGLQDAENVDRVMQSVGAGAEEPVIGKPAVLISTTDGGLLRYRDEHGNVGPLPRNRERERLVAEMERFSRLSRSEQQLYQALGAVREQRSTCIAPLTRPRESRVRLGTRARRAARRGTTRGSPDDDGGEEPEPAGALARLADRRRIAGRRS